MASRRVKKTVGRMFALIFLIIAVGLGVVLGYQFTRRQAERFAELERIGRAAEQRAAAERAGGTESSDAVSKEAGDANSAQSASAQIEIPDANTEGAIMVYIDLGDTTADIAQKLEDQGLLTNKTLFNLMSKINGFDGGYRSGTHFLKKGMTYDTMMYILTLAPKSVRITFPEGTTYIDIKRILKENGVVFDEEILDELANDPDQFLDYRFVQELPMESGREIALEGYFFPDTYDFDLNTTEEQILRTMFNNTEAKLTDAEYKRAREMNMTMDQVVRLASVIEKESSRTDEMYKVSRVFHNRLDQEMKLESCATVNYVRQRMGKEPILIVKQSDLEMESPYNTYLHLNLPPGAICNPGLEAIRAALYPDTSDMGLLYFAAKGDGTTVFAHNFEEHLYNVARYVKPLENRLLTERGESEGEDWTQLPDVEAVDDNEDISADEIVTP